ncbi:VirK/YbjX family protein [Mesorhizobium sp. PAMC28654]|uniref:DUF535 family protein n=1 Tax=Mesorhizobium sp. PAMC28654 TaxID=2880934 RepID=UPI001D0B8EC3|nr:DUF535 family protein [Mesorhizobium sp. PAMC28654]UDL89190.1 VirK/YbjX family protein [Mesorhizobium sp. PAMC28654]
MSTDTSKEPGFPGWPREAAGVAAQLGSLCARMGARRSMVFLSRVACKPVSFFKWFRFLSRFRRQHRLDRPNDDLLLKKVYKFFARGLPGGRGFDLLADHFNLAAATLPRDRLEAAWHGRPMDIGMVAGKRDAYTLTMRLAVHSAANHEGAFSIKLTRRRDRFDLVKLSFVLYKLPGGYTAAIGGIQGSRQRNSKRAVVDATRDMGGLRPKDAALLVMEGIALRGGADHLLGVSNATHTINFRVSRNRVRKHADMDEYWLDRGGQAGGEFGFVIPVRNGQIVPSSNRRDIAKREFLEIGKNLFVAQPLQAGAGATVPSASLYLCEGEA